VPWPSSADAVIAYMDLVAAIVLMVHRDLTFTFIAIEASITAVTAASISAIVTSSIRIVASTVTAVVATFAIKRAFAFIKVVFMVSWLFVGNQVHHQEGLVKSCA